MHESILFDAPIVLDSRFAHHQDVVTERMIRFRSVIWQLIVSYRGNNINHKHENSD